MEGNGRKYIALLESLYSIPQTKLDKMFENVDRLDSALNGWLWTDIEHQVSCYYAYKSDKTYPKVAQIIALLRADKGTRAVNAEDLMVAEIPEPTTNVVQIKGAYRDTVRWLHENGVMTNEYFAKVKRIPYGNGSVLKEKNLPDGRREYYIWFKKYDAENAINKAKEVYPDVFAPFRGLTFSEELAFAVQLGVFKI